MKRKAMIILPIAVLILLAVWFWGSKIANAPRLNGSKITSFAECVAAGYPVTASYPAQCMADGQVFIEEVPNKPNACTAEMRQADACAEIYEPVCVKEIIECIQAPCDPIYRTYPNACEACRGRKVNSFSPGECTKSKKECGPCPMYSPPAPGWCGEGTIVSGGRDECGCQLPGRCIEK